LHTHTHTHTHKITCRRQFSTLLVRRRRRRSSSHQSVTSGYTTLRLCPCALSFFGTSHASCADRRSPFTVISFSDFGRVSTPCPPPACWSSFTSRGQLKTVCCCCSYRILVFYIFATHPVDVTTFSGRRFSDVDVRVSSNTWARSEAISTRAHASVLTFTGIVQDVCIIHCITVYRYGGATSLSDRNIVIAAAAMHVLVRMMSSGKAVVIPTSRTTKISLLKTLIEKKYNVKPETQRLFFAGKQVSYYQQLVLILQICTLVWCGLRTTQFWTVNWTFILLKVWRLIILAWIYTVCASVV